MFRSSTFVRALPRPRCPPPPRPPLLRHQNLRRAPGFGTFRGALPALISHRSPFLSGFTSASSPPALRCVPPALALHHPCPPATLLPTQHRRWASGDSGSCGATHGLTRLTALALKALYGPNNAPEPTLDHFLMVIKSKYMRGTDMVVTLLNNRQFVLLKTLFSVVRFILEACGIDVKFLSLLGVGGFIYCCFREGAVQECPFSDVPPIDFSVPASQVYTGIGSLVVKVGKYSFLITIGTLGTTVICFWNTTARILGLPEIEEWPENARDGNIVSEVDRSQEIFDKEISVLEDSEGRWNCKGEETL